MKAEIKSYCLQRIQEFALIPEARKVLLERIAKHINEKEDQDAPIQLMYVCTHNSRRSHFGQLWGTVAANYYGVENIKTYSGGTEATALHRNVLNTLENIGFDVTTGDHSKNQKYTILFGENTSILCYSKLYDAPENPKANSVAIMTCSDAEENCPFIPGVELRVATTYEDPKIFDGTDLESEKYAERCAQIARENLYVFSLVD